jgi:CRP-like cAMP-binding protein
LGPGESLIKKGEIGKNLYLLLKGNLECFDIHCDDGNHIHLGCYGEGDIVGMKGFYKNCKN